MHTARTPLSGRERGRQRPSRAAAPGAELGKPAWAHTSHQMPRLQTLQPRLGRLEQRIASSTLAQTTRTRGGAWMRTRDRILTRDRGLCRCARCKRDGDVKPAHQVDHVIPLWAGGADDDGNLSAINGGCHKDKSAAELAMQARGERPMAPDDWLRQQAR